jgi:hypothetical protein
MAMKITKTGRALATGAALALPGLAATVGAVSALSSGGFEAAQMDTGQYVTETQKRKVAAVDQIQADTVLDDETKAELINKINIEEQGRLKDQNRDYRSAFAALGTDIQKAKEGGTPTYAARLATKNLRSVLADQPGRRQTVLSR